MYKIEKDDIIFLAQSNDALMVEYIVRVDDYDKDKNIITTGKALTIVKQQEGMMSVPSFGLASVQPSIDDGVCSTIDIHVDKFDLFGLVTNQSIKEAFLNSGSGLITNTKPSKKSILGV